MESLFLPLFESLFKEHFEPLTRFAIKYVKDIDYAKSVVHEVFIKLWEKNKTLDPDTNYKSYLYTAVRNRCLNVLRDNNKLVAINIEAENKSTHQSNMMEATELEREIDFALSQLPKKCRQVFEMSRIEELKYAEIADRMGISVKTVEAQMSKALKLLRAHLAEFLAILIFIFFE